MTSTNQIRETFLNFFAKRKHRIVPSSPLVPQNDPSLMFTNSGMVQFKNLFTGQESRDYNCAATSQKCVRAGGKHNDLENVGHTARHHTFFEMLGNFSFGDYFKEQAIEQAWTLLTKDYGLPQEKLLVTVYHTDAEAKALWKKIAGLDESRIIEIATSDNFWSMGDIGPCGPCSEIFYDHGESIFGGPPGSKDEDGDRFIEIWNLVFMQFEKFPDGTQSSLPHPSVDTGMGLERIAAVMQGKHDNYDTDTMRTLIEASAAASHNEPYGPYNVSHRVIADHLRSAAFLIAEGVLPSNEGRGYVLRRIMRRGMRHAHIMGNKDPMMHKLVPALVKEMGEHYAELGQTQPLIAETLLLEETRFKKTIDRGLKILSEESTKLNDGAPLPGNIAFKLYDTYGFPLDLTQDILRSQGRSIDEQGFNDAMKQQKAAARAAWSGSGDNATQRIWFEIKERIGSTEFLGYTQYEAQAETLALVKGDAEVSHLATGESGFLICNQTPFYAEAGGQQGDQGWITNTQNSTELDVKDTKKVLGDLWLHNITIRKGSIKVGDTLKMQVDNVRRNALARHHSATHLLHEALRQRLGKHVSQRGSLVAPERLRFDFSHNSALSKEELNDVENEANARIFENSPVQTRIMSPKEAQAMGAMALFGEKYGEEVRVVSMGTPFEEQNKPYSLELCGGTHVSATGEIGLIKLIAEENLSAGTRRIEAVAGKAALSYMRNQEQLLNDTARILKIAVNELPARVSTLAKERKHLDKELNALNRKLALDNIAQKDALQTIKGTTFSAKIMEDIPARDLKGMADNLKTQIGTGIVVLISRSSEGKASVVAGVTQDLTTHYDAVSLVQIAAQAMGGKGGGGRADMAQAGGPEGDKAQAAIEAIKTYLETIIA